MDATICSATYFVVCVCVCASMCLFLFSMLSHVRLTDSIESADSTRCVTIYLASLGELYLNCVCVYAGLVGRCLTPLISSAPACLFSQL